MARFKAWARVAGGQSKRPTTVKPTRTQTHRLIRRPGSTAQVQPGVGETAETLPQEQGQGQQGRQDVGRQLAPGQRKEDQNHGGPDQEKGPVRVPASPGRHKAQGRSQVQGSSSPSSTGPK